MMIAYLVRLSNDARPAPGDPLAMVVVAESPEDACKVAAETCASVDQDDDESPAEATDWSEFARPELWLSTPIDVTRRGLVLVDRLCED